MNLKTFKKGEVLFKENDKITNLYFVQSGGVNVCLVRGKKTLDLYQIGAQGIVGEALFNGQSVHPYTAICTVETKVLEVAADTIKPQYEAGSQLFKMVVKSLTERLKSSFNELKSIRLEKDLALRISKRWPENAERAPSRRQSASNKKSGSKSPSKDPQRN